MLHPVRVYVVEQTYPGLGVRFDVWGLYPDGDRDLIKALFVTRASAEQAAACREAAALAAALGTAIEASIGLSDHQLRGLEGDLRWAAVHHHWNEAADDCTAEGTTMLERAEAIDAFLYARP